VALNDFVPYKPGPAIVKRRATTKIPIGDVTWTAHAYENALDKHHAHLALVLGDVDANEPTLVRVHSECLTGDVFGSRRCDCGAQLQASLEIIAEQGRGVVLYVRQHEGRGIGLVDKLRAYALQDDGLDTVEANLALGHPPDRREYAIASEILQDLGVQKVRILTNNPSKFHALEAAGLEVIEQVPLKVGSNPHNDRYLRAKKEKLGHLL
jgi:3,4-dihydroxy 2-butanone 4-phosphate synthase/GTP cyclohydrolase II